MKYLQADKLMKNFPDKFLKRLINGLDPQDLKELLKPAYEYITSTPVTKQNIHGLSLIMGKLYIQIPCTESLLLDSSWLPQVRTAVELEKKNLFLKLISYQADNGLDPFNKKLFQGFEEMPPIKQKQNIDTFRSAVNQVQDISLQIFKKCLSKQLAQHRDRAIELLSLVATMNKNRRKMQYDPRVLSSDGMLANLSYLMLKLTSPILKGKNKDGSSRMTSIDSLIFIMEQGCVKYENVSR